MAQVAALMDLEAAAAETKAILLGTIRMVPVAGTTATPPEVEGRMVEDRRTMVQVAVLMDLEAAAEETKAILLGTIRMVPVAGTTATLPEVEAHLAEDRRTTVLVAEALAVLEAAMIPRVLLGVATGEVAEMKTLISPLAIMD